MPKIGFGVAYYCAWSWLHSTGKLNAFVGFGRGRNHGVELRVHGGKTSLGFFIKPHGPVERRAHLGRQVGWDVQRAAKQESGRVPGQELVGHLAGPGNLRLLQGQFKGLPHHVGTGGSAIKGDLVLRRAVQRVEQRSGNGHHAGGDGVDRVHHGQARLAGVDEFLREKIELFGKILSIDFFFRHFSGRGGPFVANFDHEKPFGERCSLKECRNGVAWFFFAIAAKKAKRVDHDFFVLLDVQGAEFEVGVVLLHVFYYRAWRKTLGFTRGNRIHRAAKAWTPPRGLGTTNGATPAGEVRAGTAT